MRRFGLNHICIRCFGREITNYTVIYGVYLTYTVLANPNCALVGAHV
jgi:hypothetical protein